MVQGGLSSRGTMRGTPNPLLRNSQLKLQKSFEIHLSSTLMRVKLVLSLKLTIYDNHINLFTIHLDPFHKSPLHHHVNILGLIFLCYCNVFSIGSKVFSYSFSKTSEANLKGQAIV